MKTLKQFHAEVKKMANRKHMSCQVHMDNDGKIEYSAYIADIGWKGGSSIEIVLSSLIGVTPLYEDIVVEEDIPYQEEMLYVEKDENGVITKEVPQKKWGLDDGLPFCLVVAAMFFFSCSSGHHTTLVQDRRITSVEPMRTEAIGVAYNPNFKLGDTVKVIFHR